MQTMITTPYLEKKGANQHYDRNQEYITFFIHALGSSTLIEQTYPLSSGDLKLYFNNRIE